MKKLILAVLAVSLLVPAQAQFLSGEATTGALFGSLAGEIFGGRHPGQAIAIGAASGLFLGSLAHAANEYNGYGYYGGYYPAYPRYGYGYGYYAHARPYGYYSPFYTSYYAAPSYYTTSPAPMVTLSPAPAADPPPVQSPPPAPSYNYNNSSPGSPMSAANALFGR